MPDDSPAAVSSTTSAPAADPDLAPVLVNQDGDVTIVTLNRPHALNALTANLLASLVEALREAGRHRAVVLRGAGRAFCVGEDLKETLMPRTGEVDELRHSFELLQDLTRVITSCAAPVIAAVRGFAVGGGAELALAADLVVIEDGTKIRFPEAPIGHAHTGGITARLPQLVGLMRAKELLLTGRWVEAKEAVLLGLALEVSPDADGRALEIARELAAAPARSIAATKRNLEVATFPHQEGALRLEIEAATHCFSAIEATNTFEQFRATRTVAGAR